MGKEGHASYLSPHVLLCCSSWSSGVIMPWHMHCSPSPDRGHDVSSSVSHWDARWVVIALHAWKWTPTTMEQHTLSRTASGLSM